MGTTHDGLGAIREIPGIEDVGNPARTRELSTFVVGDKDGIVLDAMTSTEHVDNALRAFREI